MALFHRWDARAVVDEVRRRRAAAPSLPEIPRPPRLDGDPRRPVNELRDPRGPRHRGNRGERRDMARRSRQEREDDVLVLLGVFRVASRRSVVERCFDGHPFAANRTLASLRKRGLVDVRTVERGRYGYQVFALTGTGRDLAARRLRKRRATAEAPADPPLEQEQRLWQGVGDARQLEHDHNVVEAVLQDAEPALASGARIRRVRLESELRGFLAAADDAGRRQGGPAEARRERARSARSIGLRVFAEGVPLPDALVELEYPDGTRTVRGIEVATGKYTSRQMAQKREAGFRVYGLQGFRGERGRKRYGTLNKDVEFPLDWGGGR